MNRLLWMMKGVFFLTLGVLLIVGFFGWSGLMTCVNRVLAWLHEWLSRLLGGIW